MEGGEFLLTDPLSITYDGAAKSFVRIRSKNGVSLYRTADGEFELYISNKSMGKERRQRRDLLLTHVLPDLTPGNVFDDFRRIANSVGIAVEFDISRAELSDDLPLLRSALNTFADTTLLNRVIGGER